MYVVINAECNVIPERATLLTSEGNVLLNFLRCLDYDPSDPPFADLLRRYHHLEGEWLVLSPVHWIATHNDAMITGCGKDLHIQESDAKLWFELLSQYLAEEGKILHYHNPETWLFYNDKKHVLHSKPVQYLLNQSLMPELAQLDNTMYWQKFLTECQMLFASRPNHSLINGLWVWGNAQLKDKKTIAICADEQFLPWAKICGANVSLYHPSLVLKDYKILLLTEFSMLSEQHQEELEKMTVHWYWNNAAYIQFSGGWLVHLWRKLTHAY